MEKLRAVWPNSPERPSTKKARLLNGSCAARYRRHGELLLAKPKVACNRCPDKELARCRSANHAAAGPQPPGRPPAQVQRARSESSCALHGRKPPDDKVRIKPGMC